MDKQRIALQNNPLGLQPEQVLVLETVGSIPDFIRAVEKIPGLEWLGEYALDGIAPDHGFEDATHPDKELKGQLFVVMTDQRALDQLRRLFEGWERNPNERFQRGLARLKEVFKHLHTIRPWGIEDRVRETGILENWRFLLEHEQGDVPFEAELWFRKSPTRRWQAESQLRSLIEFHEGTVIQQCVIPEIAYHGILGRMPRAQVQAIMEDQTAFRNISLLRSENIMYVRPVGQCGFHNSDDTESESISDNELARLLARSEPVVGSPVVALLDGMPLTGHRLLDNRVTVDDPDDYESAYQARDRIHGTVMASLICHGDLNRHGDGGNTPLYVRPILKPRRGINRESIPEDVLPVDLVHRAVRRLFESENGEPPASSEVRVINLSVCDPDRHLVREMSAWARLLDWLAWKYQVLFIVSAGNHSHNLELDIPRPSLDGLSPAERARAIIKALAADTRNRRLLAPAETLNGLTVGASHDDASSPRPGTHLINPFVQPGLPSILSAHGPGYRGAMKPDIFLPGGRQLFRRKSDTTLPNAILEVESVVSPPGQRVAVPGVAGQLDRTQYTRGTSNATALASRGASALLRLIDELREESGNQVPAEYDVVLMKALLVHGADWEDAKAQYTDALRTPDNSRMFNAYLGRFLGYGSANFAKVMTCTEQRVTVLGFGDLDDGEGAVFQLPLPPSLLAKTVTRRLTITLAWLSPINGVHQNYRVAHLWFNPKRPKSELAPKRRFADHRAVQRGTVQHEVLEGDKAMAFKDGDAVEIKVNCRADAGNIPAPIPYGLAVTLEVAENIVLPIYEEVRDRLTVRVPVQEVGAA